MELNRKILALAAVILAATASLTGCSSSTEAFAAEPNVVISETAENLDEEPVENVEIIEEVVEPEVIDTRVWITNDEYASLLQAAGRNGDATQHPDSIAQFFRDGNVLAIPEEIWNCIQLNGNDRWGSDYNEIPVMSREMLPDGTIFFHGRIGRADTASRKAEPAVCTNLETEEMIISGRFH